MLSGAAPGAPVVDEPGTTRRVPSVEWPTLAAAAFQAADGTRIELASGHREVLQEPLILEAALCIEGDKLAGTDTGGALPVLTGEDGIIVAAGPAKNRVMLRRLRLRITGGGPALLVVGGCTVQECDIESTGVGVEVAARSGDAAGLLGTVVHDCQVGVSLAGGAAAALLEGSEMRDCQCGIALTGLDLEEGWSEALAACADVTMVRSTEADLRIQGWNVLERDTGRMRHAPPGEEVSVRGWPHEQCTVVAPTDHGPVVLHIKGGSLNTTLFEDEEAAGVEDVEEQETTFECPAVQEVAIGNEYANELASKP